jgi:hypothetical protein
VVDVVSHPNGRSFLDRDAMNVAAWLALAGHPAAVPGALARRLADEARLALGGNDCSAGNERPQGAPGDAPWGSPRDSWAEDGPREACVSRHGDLTQW